MHLKLRDECIVLACQKKHRMDLIFDLFTLRNVNRPYTETELKEVQSKDHSIHDDSKKSRLSRCISFTDVDDTSLVDNDTQTEQSTQQITDEPEDDVVETSRDDNNKK